MDPRTAEFGFVTEHEAGSSLSTVDKQRLRNLEGASPGENLVVPEALDPFSSNDVSRNNLNYMVHNDRWLPALSPIISTAIDGQPALVLECPHPSCNSKALFKRQCDLDKHYRLHFRKHFCRIPGCRRTDLESPLGFATTKDRDRHERLHNPSITCQYCGRLFSRFDNLRAHCRRRHRGA